MVKDKKDINNDNTYSYIALGSFDGLHKGHLSLVEKIVKLSKQNGCKSIVYTFKNHPRTLLKRNGEVKLLLDNKNKVDILKEKGVNEVVFEEFTEEFMKISPKNFISNLCEKFNVKGIVVGFNYRFGYKNLGDVELLKKLSTIYNYELYVMEPCKYDNEVVSSSRIRNELLIGNVEIANEMLTRPFSLKGEVIKGKQIGRQIGFPTANLDYDTRFILPKIGVYYTNVEIKDKIYKGITSVGTNPTVNGKNITVETYILDFSDDIYGCDINVYFIKKIRDEKKFNSVKELSEQLERDKNSAQQEKLYVDK